LRPHTLTIPKPLIPVSGKPIVQWLIEELIKICNKPIDEIAYVIGNFGKNVENDLLNLAEFYNSKGKIYYQEEALGTAHAVFCAEESLDDEIIVAFADTIFFADFHLETKSDAIIWVNEVEDPSSFGVVKINKQNIITDFIEKPKTFVSNKAIIGIYYFKNGVDLKNEIKFLIENQLMVNDEYQLTDALENLKNKNYRFSPGVVDQWLDCGNKNATLKTQNFLLDKFFKEKSYYETSGIKNSRVISPCYIHPDVSITNSVIGPYVSIEKNTTISNAIISCSIIGSNTSLVNLVISDSMIGNNAVINLKNKVFSMGDYNTYIE